MQYKGTLSIQSYYNPVANRTALAGARVHPLCKDIDPTYAMATAPPDEFRSYPTHIAT